MTSLILISALSALAAGTYRTPLSGLPSPEGAHVTQLKAMGDNAWLNLGSPKPDSAWGTRRGASWTPKMVYAPDLRGAFVYGSGRHGYVKPDGHYQDDLWFYDINAHQWRCPYPGTGNDWILHIDSNGSEANASGEPLPVAVIGHGYNLFSYDSDLKKFVFMKTDDPFWTSSLPLRMSWLPSGSNQYYSDGLYECPWYFDVATGKWERMYPSTGSAIGNRLESAVEYIPSIKKVFYQRHSQTWFYSHSANAWNMLTGSGTPHSSGGYDCVMAYDSKRDRVYIGKGSEFSAYDVKTNAWIALAGSAVGSGVESNMTYDAANDVVLVNIYNAYSGGPAVKVYNPVSNQWSSGLAAMPSTTAYRPIYNAFYDPVLNFHFFFGAGDSEDDGIMLAYRYKKAAGSAAEIKTQSAEPLTLTPNPVRAGGQLRLTGIDGRALIRVYDLRGKLAADLSGSRDFRLPHLSPGLYLIKAHLNGSETTKCLVVQ